MDISFNKNVMKKHALLTVSVIIGLLLTSHAQQYIRIDTSFYSAILNEEKMVDVYIPGDYYQNPGQQYAVIYFLHGAGGNHNSGVQPAMHYYLQHFQDTTITSPPAIFVCMDGSCLPYKGSFYVNSVLYGDYEDYVMQDVIGFIQSGFRVINDKAFRFICGVSMGGSGTAWLSVNYPEMFRAAFPYIGFLSVTDTTMNNWRNLVYLENGSYNLNYNAGPMTQLFFTGCGAFSPNLNIPPYYIEIPFDTLGNWVDTVLTKWDTFDCSRYVKELPDANELSWFLGCGTLDVMCTYPTYQVFMDSLDFYGIDYDTCFFPGDHILHTPTWKAGMHWMDSIINQSFIIHVDVNNLSDPTIQASLFPNPADESCQLTFTLDQPASVRVDILNASGGIVRKSDLGIQSSGEHTKHLDIRNLASGIYICKLQAGDQTVVMRLIKL